MSNQTIGPPRCGFLYFFARAVVTVVYFACGGNIRGIRNIPRKGPVIFASNHVSHFDPPLIHIALWPRTWVYSMAKQELFKGLGAWLMPQLAAFAVNRGGADRAALRQALEILEAGNALILFPEGTRSETGDPLPLQEGIALLASRTGATIVPMYIGGTGAPSPTGFPIIRIGEPIGVVKGANREKIMRTLEEQMHALR